MCIKMQCVLLLLCIALFPMGAVATSVHYHIVPVTSTALCSQFPNGTCFTLAELSRVICTKNCGNMTLSFLPVEHILTQTIRVIGSEAVNMIGESMDMLTSGFERTTIRCNSSYNSGFEIFNSKILKINGLTITGCSHRRYGDGGGALFVKNVTTMSLTHCHFINNTATTRYCGGAAYLVYISNISIINSRFQNNVASCSAQTGGALSVAFHSVSQKITITGSIFQNNTASVHGGAIYVRGLPDIRPQKCHTWFNGSNNKFNNNSALKGGAIYVENCCVSLRRNMYVRNVAENAGGAIFLKLNRWQNFTIHSRDNHYVNNTANVRGGAVIHNSNATFIGDFFIGNIAKNGAAIYAKNSLELYISHSTFVNNSVSMEESGKGIIYALLSTVIVNEVITLKHNQGSLFFVGSQVYFRGYTICEFGHGQYSIGGAITGLRSQITFEHQSETLMQHNTISNYGGGLYLSESTMTIYGSLQIIKNFARFGGGIYAYRSSIQIGNQLNTYLSHIPNVTISTNTAAEQGGGVYLSASTITITTNIVYISRNRAIHGGGIFLDQGSQITLLKYTHETNKKYSLKLNFTGNSAYKGGALFVLDDSNIGMLCKGVSEILYSAQCFVQTLAFYENDNSFNISQTNFVNIIFKENTANYSGDDIYGGLLDRCSVSPLAEVVSIDPEYTNNSNGLSYLNAIANFGNNTSNQTISSDPIQLCFCSNNGTTKCTESHPTISVKKGETFKLLVFSIDQSKNLLNATVIASYISTEGIGGLKEGQQSQKIGQECTELKYNVFSTADNAIIQLYANGPCKNLGISKRQVNITFIPCTCPVGFEPTSSPIACECVCNQRLKPYISNCTYENASVTILKHVWIHHINDINDTGFIVSNCPSDYCLPLPLYTNLNNSDSQCASNRTGTICGACVRGHSMVFGGTQCKSCSNHFISLLVPFALAGVVLVLLILMFNLTVAVGTVSGLIFCANIIAANKSIFLPFDTPNYATVFISWLNLDVGFEVCFYNGMDSYGKLLLQLVFPVYLFVLVGIIIVLAEYSTRFAHFIGTRNPVATLSTVILLSYSKLVRFAITALRFDQITYPNGSTTLVWSYDANIPYFSASHAPRFISALLILTLGAVYTILVLCGQWLVKCSERRCFRWIGRAEYNTFIQAYNAPYVPTHRYWFGLLLLLRIIHSIISAFASDSVVILCVGVSVFLILSWQIFHSKIYENWLIGFLETIFMVNLGILSIATYFVTMAHGYQQTLAYISVMLYFVTFLCIFIYHMATYVVKVDWSKAENKLVQTLNRLRNILCRKQEYILVPMIEEDDEESKHLAEDELLIAIQQHGYIGDATDESQSRPREQCDPPVIQSRSSAPVDQLREPDLDILAPVREEDYIAQPAKRQRPTVVTYSEVSIAAN